MPLISANQDLDVAYAIEQLQADVPAEEILLQIYSRASSIPGIGDAFNYSINVLEKACLDLEVNFDRTLAGRQLRTQLDQHPEASQSTTHAFSLEGYADLDADTAADLQTIAGVYGTSFQSSVHSPDRTSGIYRGPILLRLASITVQQTGPGNVTLHLNRNLDQRCAPGDSYSIRYSSGEATVKPMPQKERKQDRERELV